MSEYCITWEREQEWCPTMPERNWDSATLWKERTKQEADILVFDVDRTLEVRFREQSDKWARETEHLSSPTQIMSHPSYQAVLGMGHEHKTEIIRLLLRDLRDNRRPWFWALSYLTHENPIDPKDAGRMDKMIRAWSDWGSTRGLL